ncbi:MAG: hypothetical protein GY841_17100, partial [FCB group bacterium]|nr:hypothetical protein [FCB group bacterium]
TNSGNTAAVGVALSDAVPAHSELVAGTVQTSQGTVITSDPVEVALGQVDPGVAATVTFRVRIDQPFPSEVAEVANQATVEAAGLDPVLSDDPETEPLGDPTATAVYVTPEVSVDDVTVAEGAPEAIFTVSLDAASNRTVTVSYQSADGTAVAGLDYESATGVLVFAS